MQDSLRKNAWLTVSTQRLLAPLILALPLATGAAAQDGVRTGKAVVDAVCIQCHGPGTDGAPKIGDKAQWSKRSAQGLSALTAHAIGGIRKMPAHGGNPGVSDLEISRAIAYMVNQSGGHWTEPTNKDTVARDLSGEQVVQLQCMKCHEHGEGGAPKIGDRAAWIPRASHGIDPLVRSAIKGHGGMPSRGGMAELTDGELRSAIVYMFNSGAVVKK